MPPRCPWISSRFPRSRLVPWLALGLVLGLSGSGCREQGTGGSPQVSEDRVVQALFTTAQTSVAAIAARHEQGKDIAADCRTARALFVAELAPLPQRPVQELLAKLQRLCPAPPAAGGAPGPR